MSKFDLTGAHVLNKFVWNRLSNELGMTRADYQGLVPIIPSQQLPVFTEMGPNRPFIVYTYGKLAYSTDIWEHVEQLAYTVYSEDESQLRRVTNFLADLLRRFDIVAQEVNDYVNDALVNPSGDEDDRGFDFKYINVTGLAGPEPFTSEGGRQASSVTIRYAYTTDEDQSSRRTI